MFDIGWDELLVIAIVALVVIGPKDLPHAFRIAGQWMAKARRMAREFQSHIDDLMQESEMNELKREFSDVTRPPELDALESELMSGQLPVTPQAAISVDNPVQGPAVVRDADGKPAGTENDPPRAA